MSLEKDLSNKYLRPVKEKDLFKTLKKTAKKVSKMNISLVKKSDDYRLNKKVEKKIISDNFKSAKWLQSLISRK
ncbi:MAG: hypothetical protein F6K48_01700 [Okeania sp. SIO3H1]|uniref:hypothetical protein n=1 Tax=Okeania sp. SIO1I7 TaxID=2607772 RepID=UPI0013C9DE2A|nr:hypothetical protein [Okeania sp. SIO1I7]NEN87700.1 hypothetical protein [Okeania sp. SIO3H1]NET24695.1 hypothetical protein [Okeania sp. SIO1I7]